MSETVIIAVAGIVGVFAVFSLVLAWADRRTRDLPERHEAGRRPG